MVMAAGEAAPEVSTPFRQPGWQQARAGAGWHRQLATLEGWRHFTTSTSAAPDLLPSHEREGLADDDRSGYDEHRLDYHTRLAVVATRTLWRG